MLSTGHCEILVTPFNDAHVQVLYNVEDQTQRHYLGHTQVLYCTVLCYTVLYCTVVPQVQVPRVPALRPPGAAGQQAGQQAAAGLSDHAHRHAQVPAAEDLQLSRIARNGTAALLTARSVFVELISNSGNVQCLIKMFHYWS